MKTKNITLVIASVFALVLFLAFASASLDFVSVTNDVSTLEKGQSINIQFMANETGVENVTAITFDAPLTLTSGAYSFTTPAVTGAITSLAQNSTSGQMTLSVSVPVDQEPGIYNGVLSMSGTGDINALSDTLSIQITVTAPLYTFCSTGDNSSDLDLSIDINNKGNGDDDKWLPLDTIEIEVELENDKDSNGEDTYDLEDVVFEMSLQKVGSTSNLAEDMIWISKDAEEFEFGDIKEGKDGEHIFEFRVNPAEFDDGDYILMIKAYGKDDNNADVCIEYSSDLGGSFGSSIFYAEIEIELEGSKDNMVIIDTESLSQDATASCEQEVTFTANVYNIGDKDFEDQVLVTLYNSALGVDQNVTITGDFDAGDNAQVTFTFEVPEGMDEKLYNLEMKTYYDYDVDDVEYDEVSDETFVFPLTLAGNCVIPEVIMSASLEEGGKAGETLVVKATVTNSGTEETTYTFAVKEYSSWASNAQINGTLTLAPGESQDIWVSFDVSKKAAGDQTFYIETTADGGVILTQPVQVSIEARNALGFNGENSAIAILIALISAIAIAIIIVLIVRASKKE